MAPKTPPPKDTKRSKNRTVRRTAKARDINDHPLVIGVEVGVSLPVGDTYAHLRYSFWCEQAIENKSMAARKRAAADLDEWVEAELDRRVRKSMKVIRRALDETGEEEVEVPKEPRSEKVSVRDRARKKIR
jgi:hypothetical protein